MNRLITILKTTLFAFVLSGLIVTHTWSIDIGTMTWTPRSDWINVKSPSSSPGLSGYTAAVGNGTADDTAAIQAILTYLSNHSNGYLSTVYFPAGTYKISSSLVIANVPGFQMIGSGSSTIIKWGGAAGGAMMHPENCSFAHYWGLVWDGSNAANPSNGASCAFEFNFDTNVDGSGNPAPGEYETQVRHENESFKNFTVTGTYPFLDANKNPTTGAPAAAIITAFPQGGITADSIVTNCKFLNCTTGIYLGYAFTQVFEWHVSDSQFESCGNAFCGGSGYGYDLENCHFQGSTWDVTQGGSYHLRHCTSSGSNGFAVNIQGVNMIQDCWVDSWHNTSGAIQLVGAGSHTVMDCTFTTPPAGAAPPIQTLGYSNPEELLMSGNYAPGFGSYLGIINNGSGVFNNVDMIPPGLRGGIVTSATQTFLKTANFTDSTNILDVTLAPYSADKYGSTDASSAVASALSAARTANNGSVVYFPTGFYKVSTPLSVSGGNFTIQGTSTRSVVMWTGTAGGTALTIANPSRVLVQNIDFAPQATDNDYSHQFGGGIKETATGTSSITFDGYSYNWIYGPNLAQRDNGYTVGMGINPGLVLSSLPAGSQVYIPYMLAPMQVQNSGAAQVLIRNMMSPLAVSGTGAKTGFLGIVDAENIQQQDPNGYVFTVTDNQNLVVGNHYNESDYNLMSLSNGGSSTAGHVSIEGSNYAAWNSGIALNAANYLGRVFFGGYTMQTTASGNSGPRAPVRVTQTGSNSVDFDLVGLNSLDGPPTVSTGVGAKLLESINFNFIDYGDPLVFPADTPSPLTQASYQSISNGLDDFRQLGQVDGLAELGLAIHNPPVASFGLDGDATDQTGTYNGTNYGATFTDGEVNLYAASFDGSTQYIDFSTPSTLPNGTAARTIAGWGKSTTTGAGYRWITAYGSPNTDQAMFIGMNGSDLVGGGYGDDLTVTGFWDTNWHYIVLTYDGTTAKLYADGVLKTSAAKSWSLVNSHAYIGKQVNGGEFWNGQVDQVQVYNYALSATDVAYNYNRQRTFGPLSAYWKLDETTGSTSADSSGNGVTGTWNNSPVFTSDHPALLNGDAGSLSFNGSNQTVTITKPSFLPAGSAPRTLSAWAKTTTSTGNQFIASFGAPSTDNAMLIGMESGTLYGGGYNNDLTVPNCFNDTNWHYVALTYDGNTERLYFDGALRQTLARQLNLTPTSAYIAQLVGNTTADWNGSIDDVKVYNRALSSAEIANVEGLQAYWPLDETAGTTSADLSGHGDAGLWVNGPTATTDHPSVISFTDARSLNFNAASSQYVTMGTPANLPSGTSPRTICGWAKSAGTGGYGMFASYGTAAAHSGFWIGANGTSLSAGSWADDMPDIPGFWDGNWHFIALTYDGTTAKLYADGVLKESAAKTWTLVPSVCYIGCYLNNSAFWNGSVDDVRIYNRALTASEVSRIAAGNP